MNITIFDIMYEKIKLIEPIKMFEAFSGIGTQAMALKKLGVEYEIVGYSEIDKYAIQSYKAIHGDHIKNYGDITKMTTIPSCDIFTWSFPCTDLSKAGKQKGMTKETRSGLVYDVLRLVRDTKDKPKVLIMENVPDLVHSKFSKEFRKIQLELENYGYKNYIETLNSKDYGVAQNRDRVFMVSVLGDYSYSFPDQIKLEKKLKDYLEKDVDEKFYISEKSFKYLSGVSKGGFDRQDMFKPHNQDSDYAWTITTRTGSRPTDNFIKIPQATKKGYAIAKDGDGVYIDRPEQKRGVVQKGMIQTLKTTGDDVGVVDNLRIRKLTPKECWRLMGCSDEDFEKAAKVCSNTQLYKQAGNAIVVDVFEKILRGLL